MKYVQKYMRLKEFRVNRCVHGGFGKGANHYFLTCDSMVC